MQTILGLVKQSIPPLLEANKVVLTFECVDEILKYNSGSSRIFERGVADLTESYQNNPRQNCLSDSFVPFLKFKLK